MLLPQFFIFLFIYFFLGLPFPTRSLPGTDFIHPTLGASQKPHLCRRLAAGRRKLPAPGCHQDEQGEPLQAELVNPQHRYSQELTAHLVSHSTGSSRSPFCSQLLHALPNLPVPNTFQAHIKKKKKGCKIRTLLILANDLLGKSSPLL